MVDLALLQSVSYITGTLGVCVAAVCALASVLQVIGKKRYHPQNLREFLILFFIIFPIVVLNIWLKVGDFWVNSDVGYGTLFVSIAWTLFLMAWILGITRFYDLWKSSSD